jgi:DNA-directed RNA polymerase beta subunit
MKFDWNKHTWDVIDNAFKGDDRLLTHQHESYNNMIESTIPSLMMHGMPITVKDLEDTPTDEHSFTIVSCGMSKPVLFQTGQGHLPMLPSEARNRDLTYAAPLYIDTVYTHRQGKDLKTHSARICVAKIPVMVGSKWCHLYGRSRSERAAVNECPLDRGGYFIIKGSEKVVISQERPVENIIACFPESDPNKPYESRAEVKSTIDQRFFPIKIAMVRLTKYQESSGKEKDKNMIPGHKLVVGLPYGRRPVPLFVIFKAFGVVSDEEIFSYLLDKDSESDQDFVNLLIPSAQDAHNVATQADAIRYVANSININITDRKVQDAVDDGGDITDDIESANSQLRMSYASDLLNREFIPHVGNNPTKKLRFLGLMVQRLLKCKLNPLLFSDRDKLTNKRLDLPGSLIFQIFRHYFQKMLKDIKAEFVRAIRNSSSNSSDAVAQAIKKIIQKSNIQNKLSYALSTGNWYTSRSQANSASKKGTAQVLQRLSYLGTISHCRHIHSPLERAGSKHVPPRQYHGTQAPKICPPETPEGAQVGSVKNLSIMTHVSIETSSYPVMYALSKLGLIPTEEASALQVQRQTKVMVNGDFVGVCGSLENTVRIVTILKYLRRTGILNSFISITWLTDFDRLVILTDGGRYSTPYYIVDPDGHLQIDQWQRHYARNGGAIPDLDRLIEGLDSDSEGQYAYNEIYKVDEYQPWRGAAIEYLDTDEEETAMIAVRPEQLFAFQTMTKDNGTYYGHLTQAIKMTNSAAQKAELERIMNDRVKLRDYENGKITESDRADIEDRRKRQDKLLKENADEQNLSIMERIVNRLEDQAQVLFQGCVTDVHVIGEESRMIRIVPTERELTTAEVHLLTNLNRFLSRDYVPYTHLLLHPAIIHGVVAGNIPFPDHNASPRNCYQSSMGKQAIGTYVTNHNQRMDTMSNVLVYPQRPLVATRLAKHTRMDYLHHGYNAMIAIANYTGYNQEDSLIGNLSSSQRGCYNTAWYRTYTTTLQKLTSNDASESFEVPPEKTIGRKVGTGGRDRYHAIQLHHGKSKGRKPELPKIGAFVTGNDIIIPKSKKVTSKTGRKGAGDADTLYTDLSVTVKPSESGVIDMVIPNEYITNNENEDAYQFVKVRICEMRQPEIGDKFASRAAQKGTEGIQLNAADIIFNGSGVAPDKIMNAHAIPSRMTHGQLIESISSKEGALTGKYHDATPFSDFNLEKTEAELAMCGYDRCGDEIMYNGQTGEPMETPITFWPTYYQRLKHMVADKMHARALGPIQALTKQPAEGRSKMGGLRLGEMERDCLIAHACAWYLKEKTVDSSDIFEVFLSEQKRTVIAANPKMGIFQNGTEEIYDKDDICKIHMPYAMNLFRNELRTILVDVQMVV